MKVLGNLGCAVLSVRGKNKKRIKPHCNIALQREKEGEHCNLGYWGEAEHIDCRLSWACRSTFLCCVPAVPVPSICLIDKLYKEIISSQLPHHTRVAIIGQITETIGPVKHFTLHYTTIVLVQRAPHLPHLDTYNKGERKSRIKSLLSSDVFILSTAPGQKVQTSPDSLSNLIFNLRKIKKGRLWWGLCHSLQLVLKLNK